MRFMFKILVLGETDLTFPYILNAMKEKGEDMETYYEWFEEFNVLDNICDLEIDVVTDIISANFDDIIPMVDGIVFILNPANQEEFEFFEMLVDIIESVKRDIPMVILFYDKDGITPISTNKLLQSVWGVHPDFEAFANLHPHEFHQVIHCLCLSMISGDPPLNIENAWMRLPIFIQMANYYYEQRIYIKAAHALKKIATIADIYNKNEYYIYCEQAAYLYSKANRYLEASKIMKDVSKIKVNNFKKLYVENMIREGNRMFNKKSFEMAAKQYETAGQWTSIELKDKSLINEAFRLAINSWISACKNQDAFRILERLDHEEIISVLNEISDKIIAATNFLMKNDQLERAKRELYLAINTYQKEDLFDHIEKFSKKLAEVLIKILEKEIEAKELYQAKETYDELENIWETYEIEKSSIDNILVQLIKMFCEQLNFSMASILINKLDSLELKQELTEYSSEVEEKHKESRKLEKEKNFQKGIEIIREFVIAEYDIIRTQNKKVLHSAQVKADTEDFLKAAQQIKDQVDHLSNTGMEDVADQLLTNALDYLVQGKLFPKFFVYFRELQKSMKKKYLRRIFPILGEKLDELARFEELKKRDDYKLKNRIFKMINQLYRNSMLYEKSREITYHYITLIKNQALKIVQEEETKQAIKSALKLIKKVNNLSSAYLNSEKILFDKIYKRIAEIYITLGDLSSAHAYNDRIEEKEYKSEIHKKIAKIESSQSALKSKKAEESLKGEILKEQISIIKKKARDARAEKENDLKQRKGLKRAFFKKPLESLKNQEYNDAFEEYKRATLRLNRIKKYNLAGIAFMGASLILLKQKKIGKLRTVFENLKEEISSSSKILYETFPMILIKYILSLEKIGDEAKLDSAISYIESLPLFEEELDLLYEILGKEKKERKEQGEVSSSLMDAPRFKAKIKVLSGKIEKSKQDISKRKLMKGKYWQSATESLKAEDYFNASMNYLDAVGPLMEKKFEKHAAIGLILGCLSLIKARSLEVAQSTFKDKIGKYGAKLKSLPEITLIDHLFAAFQENLEGIVSFGIEKLVDTLILFKSEIAFLEQLGHLDKEKSKKEDTAKPLSRHERAELNKLKLDLDQTYGVLNQRKRDIKAEFSQLFRKRKAMRRRFYADIINLLEQEKFQQAAAEYKGVASKLVKRKDTNTISLLIVLSAFCELQETSDYEQIRQNVDHFIQSLNINAKLIEDTFSIILLKFILTLKANGIQGYSARIKKLLEVLPLFDEEKELIKI